MITYDATKKRVMDRETSSLPVVLVSKEKCLKELSGNPRKTSGVMLLVVIVLSYIH